MQTEEVNLLMDMAEEAMQAAVTHLQYELTKVRTGKASSSMLNDLMVSYYGAMTPLTQVANVATSDSRTITIQPWEKNMLGPIEKAIFEANMGITPMNDGEKIHLSIPPLTEERRAGLAKQVKHFGEEAKISLRGSRHKALDGIKKAVKDGFSEDAGKRKETEVQDLINKYTKQIEHLVETKEKDVMTV